MADDKQIYVVGGIAFTDIELAKAAQNELKRIDILNQKMDYNNVASMALVYEKAIENRLFHTPIGLSYLLHLQTCLIEHGYDGIEDKPIPMQETRQQQKQSEDMQLQHKQNAQKDTIWNSRLMAQKEKQKQIQNRYRMSLLCNGILIILIIVLFLISQTGKNPTVLNYKTKIINQYTTWEQELNDREQKIEEKEAELGLIEE